MGIVELPPIISPRELEVVEEHNNKVLKWICKHHYLHSTPAGARVRIAVYHKGWLVGALLIGRPVARNEDQYTTVELTRMVLLDVCPKNSESYVLSRAIKIVRKKLPEVRRIIAYADSTRHTGAIYKAVGFRCVGMTAGEKRGWQRQKRKGRRSTYEAKKYKFELRW